MSQHRRTLETCTPLLRSMSSETSTVTPTSSNNSCDDGLREARRRLVASAPSAVLIGDLIDRGAQQLATVEIVRAMVASCFPECPIAGVVVRPAEPALVFEPLRELSPRERSPVSEERQHRPDHAGLPGGACRRHLPQSGRFLGGFPPGGFAMVDV